MRGHDDTSARVRRRGPAITALALACALFLTGCDESTKRGFLPHGVTDQSDRIITLWNGSWLAALGVGALVWGLIFWCMVAYRHKKDDVGLPEQLRYNVPIEILYTVVPLFMITALFYYTARDQSELLKISPEPDVTINVVGKQWSWDFNYVEADTYESGTQAELTGKFGVAATLPPLYLPVNKRVLFILTSRDVMHSFWVPQFLMKMDMIPGKVNRFEVVPKEIGSFQGRCAELCGTFHAHMLFRVEVVSQATYDAHLAELRAKGNVGQLDNSLNRAKIQPSDLPLLPRQGASP